MQTWKTLMRDPLCHFVLFGAVLFAINAVTGQTPGDNKVITVDQARIDWLVTGSTQERGRSPTPNEVQQLVDNYIQEEILYREAMALGLGEDDAIVRRRLIKKLRFMIEDVAMAEAPSQETLHDFYLEHTTTFRQPETYSFSHHYFSADSRSDARQDAMQALAQLTHEQVENPPRSLGDAFMLGHSFASKSHTQVVDLFGEHFASSVTQLPEAQWQGPLPSAYGWHLVKLTQKHPGYLPEYHEIKDDILALWQAKHSQKANDQAYERLQSSYRIERADNELMTGNRP